MFSNLSKHHYIIHSARQHNLSPSPSPGGTSIPLVTWQTPTLFTPCQSSHYRRRWRSFIDHPDRNAKVKTYCYSMARPVSNPSVFQASIVHFGWQYQSSERDLGQHTYITMRDQQKVMAHRTLTLSYEILNRWQQSIGNYSMTQDYSKLKVLLVVEEPSACHSLNPLYAFKGHHIYIL